MPLADEVLAVAVKQLPASQEYRQPRLNEILENEKIVAGEIKPALQGRYAIPFDSVVANGFVDTLTAQINKPPRLEFYDDKGSNLKASKKITAMYEKDSNRHKWAKIDRLSKRLCAISNMGILKVFAESDPEYCSYLQNVDHYDFHCEPNGGGNLEDHLFAGQSNIFKSDADLEYSSYDQKQIALMKSRYTATDFKFNEDLYRNKVNRMQVKGLNIENHNFIGSNVYNFTEWVTTYKGTRYYLVFDYKSNTWLKFGKLTEFYESNLYPWIVWQARESAFNMWSRGPFDDIKPIAEAIRINLNEILNNNRKRNWDMKAVDMNVFPDLSQLDYRPDGIAVGKVPAGQTIQGGIYNFQTPEISGAINLNNYLNNFMGEKSGINSQTQGTASEDRVGIYEGNTVQVSKRMKLIGDSYDDAWHDVGIRYDWGLWEHLPEGEMVKIIGIEGAEWDEIKKEDTEPEYLVRVISRVDEMNEEIMVKRVKLQTLQGVEANPMLFQLVNPKVFLEMKLDMTGFDNDSIGRLMDTKNTGSDIIISEAKKGIELILKGKDADIERNADSGFLQTIHNFMADNGELKPEIMMKLQAYFDAHVQIAAENQMREMENNAMPQPGVPGQTPPPTSSPAPELSPLPVNPIA